MFVLLMTPCLLLAQKQEMRRFAAVQLNAATYEFLGDSTEWPLVVSLAERNEALNEFILNREALSKLHELRILLERHSIVALTKLQDRVCFTFTDAGKFLEATRSVQNRLRLIDDRTAHLLLEKGEHDVVSLVALLKRILGGAPAVRSKPAPAKG